MSERLAPTEREHPQATGLDLLPTPQLVELLIADQREAVDAVISQTQNLSRAVDEIAKRLERGGRLHYVGAGSSGRIATLDASEMPPTFGTPHEMVHAHVAGGAAALLEAVEGAEDDADAGDAAARECVRAGDAVVGISAGGTAAYVVAAIARAATIGAYTVGLTSAEGSPLALASQEPIVLATGAEVLTGSTRLKAGTAQKIALNAISTAVMVRLGKVFGNLMVDLVAKNRKLHARALRIVAKIGRVDEERAGELLDRAGGRVKVAVVMERRKLDAAQAEALLESHNGLLRKLL
jgi:N-acetylmuramic acid 6-phosphate etherase